MAVRDRSVGGEFWLCFCGVLGFDVLGLGIVRGVSRSGCEMDFLLCEVYVTVD